MIYILSIPLQLIHSLGRWSVLVAVVGGWALWGLEGISTELEGVFGRSSEFGNGGRGRCHRLRAKK
jgi:predicted membrane chloride channel (bestrophin family)